MHQMLISLKEKLNKFVNKQYNSKELSTLLLVKVKRY